MVERRGWTAIVAVALVVCGVVVGLRAQTYGQEDARFMARRLYLGILGREADGPGLSVATAAILRGELNRQVQAMCDSAEFRQTTRNKRAADIVDQFYRGILGRGADPSGLASYTPRVEAREYAGVVLELLGSSEFRKVMGAAEGSSGSDGGGASTRGAGGRSGEGAGGGSSSLNDVYVCQSMILYNAWHAAGDQRVFLTFDRMPQGGGDNWQGDAVDRFFNRDRRLSYQCTRADATFSYADRGAPTGADPREPFPSAAVRNCESAKGGSPFVAAALSASPTATEYVLGWSRDTGLTMCTMDRQRVVSVDTIK
jgi:hypothetical protein